MNLTLLTLIIGLIPPVLKGIPGISADIQTLIADVDSSVVAVLGSGAITQPGVNTVLAAWSGVIAALKNDPNLPAASLSAVGQLEKIVQAVMTEDAALAKSVDWTQFHQIAPVA